MSTINDSDIFVIGRGGSVFKCSFADIKANKVRDTDIFIVGRGRNAYKCSYADLKKLFVKIPLLNSVTLADSPEGTRFTSATFASTVSLVEGMPVSTKGIKAWIEGALKSAALTDAITNVATSTANYSQYMNPQMGQSSANTAFNGQINGGTTGSYYAPGGGSATWTAPGTGIPFTKLVIHGGIHDHVGDGTIKINGVDLTSKFPAADMTVAANIGHVDLTAFVTSPLHTIQVTSVRSGTGFALAGVEVDGYLLKDGNAETVLTFATNTGLAGFASGDDVTEVGGGNDAAAKVIGVDVAAKQLTVFTSAGTWDVGSKVKGPLKTSTVKVKLYCKLNAGLTVTDLQSADPGYTTVSGTGPYTVTFPATLPSGNAPDTDLPAGTTLTTEVKLTNTAGTVTKQSNTITPA